MREGRSHSFSSSVPGAKGRKEVIQKFEQWYYGEASGEKTVQAVAKEYLQDVEARCGKDSPALEQYECYIRLYVVPACGSKKICKMTLRDWQNVLNGASGRNKPLSDKTLRNLRAIIMSIIKYGYEDYQCPSEALGLKASEVSQDKVVIKRGINARGHITEGKNANAKRVIPIGELASGILRKTIRRNEEYNLHTDWIFCSPDGSQGKQNGMRKHWGKLKAERGLPGTVYSLRHTFISMMKNVLPEQSIKDVVGHSVNMDTFGTYGHIIEGEDRKIAEVIDLTFGQKFGQNESASGEQSTK